MTDASSDARSLRPPPGQGGREAGEAGEAGRVGRRTDAGSDASRAPVGTPCRNSLDCGPGVVCDAVSRTCVECVRDADCDGGGVCIAHVCQPRCDSDKDCTPQGQLCDLVSGVCVFCLEDLDCASGELCAQGACEKAACEPRTECNGDCGPVEDGCGGTLECPACTECAEGKKFCAGNCFKPNPGIGCGLTGCQGCGAPPANSFRICTGFECDFFCFEGYEREGDGCVMVGGVGGTLGAGGAAATGGAFTAGGAPSGGTAGMGGAVPCTPEDLSQCPICSGPQCCKEDGTCGCNTFWVPVCT